MLKRTINLYAATDCNANDYTRYVFDPLEKHLSDLNLLRTGEPDVGHFQHRGEIHVARLRLLALRRAHHLHGRRRHHHLLRQQLQASVPFVDGRQQDIYGQCLHSSQMSTLSPDATQSWNKSCHAPDRAQGDAQDHPRRPDQPRPPPALHRGLHAQPVHGRAGRAGPGVAAVGLQRRLAGQAGDRDHPAVAVRHVLLRAVLVLSEEPQEPWHIV